MIKAAILGAGSWGTALAGLLDKNGHMVSMWSYNKQEAEKINSLRENREYLPGVNLGERMLITGDAKAALESAELVVLSVPSKAVRSVAKDLANYIPKNAILVNAAKGLDEITLQRFSQVLGEILPNPFTVLSGPSHAEEVARDIPTACVAASANIEYAEYVQDAFMNKVFRVYTNQDVAGVEIGGALKNIIALAGGISDGLGFGDNTKAALMTRGIKEIARLGIALGGDIHSFSGLSGIGDLIVTCTSMHSRNRRAGILIGEGKSVEDALAQVHMVVEGVPTTKVAYELSLKHNVQMPIVAAVNSIIFEGQSARDAVMELMSRDRTTEA